MRATIIDQPVTLPDGTTVTIKAFGPIETIEVGTVLDNLSEAELTAFRDRLQLEDDAEPEPTPPPEPEPVPTPPDDEDDEPHGPSGRRRR